MRQPKTISAVHLNRIDAKVWLSKDGCYITRALICVYREILQEIESLVAFLNSETPSTAGSYLRDPLFIHLSVLASTLVVSAAALYALHSRSSRINSVLQLFLQPQTGITTAKCMVNVILVILLGLKVSPVGHSLLRLRPIPSRRIDQTGRRWEHGRVWLEMETQRCINDSRTILQLVLIL